MRALLAWLLVLALCGLFGYWQTRGERSLRARDAIEESAPRTLDEREGAWHGVTIGRPSGAEPFEIEVWEEPEAEGSLEELVRVREREDAEPGAPPTERDIRPADFLYLVPEGRVLSKICEEFYGTGRPPVPQRVAEYNQLESPDDLRAGFELRLPPWEILFPEGRERP